MNRGAIAIDGDGGRPGRRRDHNGRKWRDGRHHDRAEVRWTEGRH